MFKSIQWGIALGILIAWMIWVTIGFAVTFTEMLLGIHPFKQCRVGYVFVRPDYRQDWVQLIDSRGNGVICTEEDS